MEVSLPECDIIVRECRAGYDGSVLITDVGSILACGNNEHNKLGLNQRQGFLMTMKNMFNKASNLLTQIFCWDQDEAYIHPFCCLWFMYPWFFDFCVVSYWKESARLHEHLQHLDACNFVLHIQKMNGLLLKTGYFENCAKSSCDKYQFVRRVELSVGGVAVTVPNTIKPTMPHC